MKYYLLPVFDGLRTDESGAFEGELALGQIHGDWVHERESGKTVLAHLGGTTNLDVQFGLFQLEFVLLAP